MIHRLARCLAGTSVAFGIALGFGACGNAFSAGATQGPADANLADGHPEDGPGILPDQGIVDAGDDDGDAAVADSFVDAPTGDSASCQGAFAAPTLVLQHTTQYLVDSITLSSDELDAFVTLMVPGSTTEQRMVYAMHRASMGDAFAMDTSQPLDLTNVGTTPGAFDVGLSADDLTLYFSHRQDLEAGVPGVDIYEAQRGDAAATFDTTSRLGPAIDDPTTDQFHAHPAGPDLYFTVAPLVAGVQGQRDLYVAALLGGARSAISELNGATTQEANPVPSRDELEIFFSSDRANPGGNSSIYRAHRGSAALPFSQPSMVSLPTVDPATSVTPQHLSAGGCRLYVLVGQQDVFVSQRAAQ